VGLNLNAQVMPPSQVFREKTSRRPNNATLLSYGMSLEQRRKFEAALDYYKKAIC